MTAQHTRRHGRDDGDAAVEFTILATLLMAITMFVVGLGRIQQAHLSVTGMAGAAARAASLARSPVAAVAAAKTVADTNRGSWSCPRPEVAVDTAAFHPGGIVKVTVVCRPRLADVTAVGLPGHVRVAATMASGIDAWRGADAR